MSDETMTLSEHQAKMKSLRENLTTQISALKGELKDSKAAHSANAEKLAQFDAISSELNGIKTRTSEDEAFRAAGIDPSGLADRHRGYTQSLLAEMQAENPEATLAELLGSDAAKSDPLMSGLFKAAPPAAGTSPAKPPVPQKPGSPFARKETPPPPTGHPTGKQAVDTFNATQGRPLAERVAAMTPAEA